MYSLAIVLFEVLSRRRPYRDLTEPIFTAIVNGRRPSPLPGPTDVNVLMTRSWAANPAERPTAEYVREQLKAKIETMKGERPSKCIFVQQVTNFHMHANVVVYG